jgi:signal transduction histidine kinase
MRLFKRSFPSAGASPRSPRAKRHRLRVPIEYRRPGDSRWHIAVTSNLSCTGALLEKTPTTLHVGDELELRLTAPPALTGDASVPLLCTARVVRTETGTRERIAAAIQNIWLEERTAAARKARADLVHDLCHQINNSLTSIAGRADLLIVNTPDDALSAQLKAIRDAALGAALPLRQLHDVGR